jgi:hypothetical protein
VLGSGLSMVAAGIAALIFVSVLLAFHGWPGDVSSNTTPSIITVAAATPPPVPTLVIGRPAAPRRTGAATGAAPGGRARLRNGAPSTGTPTFSDLSRTGATTKPPSTNHTPPPPGCSGTLVAGQCVNLPAVAVPSQVSEVIDQVQQPSLTQQVQTGVQDTTKTAGGVIGGVVNTISKALGR